MAFMRFYIEQVNRSWMTPDDTLIPPLSEPDCRSCAALQDHAVEYVRKKQRFQQLAVEITSIQTTEDAPEGRQFLTLTFHQLPSPIVDEDGAVIVTENDKVVNARALLTWKEDRWLMFGFG